MSEALADFHEVELAAEKISELVSEIDKVELAEKFLWDGRVFMRRNAALAVRLGVELEPEKVDLLAVAAKDSDELVREYVVGALGTVEVDLKLALDALFSSLTDPVETVRDAAGESLDRLVERAGEDLVPLLVLFLGDGRGLVRSTAARMLARFGEPASEPLIGALAHDNEELRKEAYKTLERLGTRAAPELVKALENRARRQPVLQLLCQLPELDDKEREALQAYLDSDDEELRADAEKALREAGSVRGPVEPVPLEVDVEGFVDGRLDEEGLKGAKIEIDLLRQGCRDSRWFVRANSIDVLAQQIAKIDDEERTPVIYELAPLIRDEVEDVRVAAVKALSASDHPEAIGPILAAVLDASEAVVASAKAGLAKLGEDHPVATVTRLTTEHPRPCQLAIIEALAGLGKDVAGSMAEVLTSVDRPPAREMAARVLEALADDGATGKDALVDASQDESPFVRLAALDALGFLAIEDEDVFNALEIACTDTYPEVRRAAARARARLKGEPLPGEMPPEPEPIDIEDFYTELLDEGALAKAVKDIEVPRLLAALGDGRAEVRGNAAVGLTHLGEKADDEEQLPIVFGLSSLIRDENDAVRLRAVKGLATVGGEWAVSPLLRVTSDLNEEVAEAAEKGLKDIAEQIPAAVVVAVEPDLPVFSQDLAIDAVAAAGADAVEAVAELLSEAETVFTKAAAATTLQRIGGDAKKAVPALIQALTDTSEVLRRAAVLALGKIVEKPEEDVMEALDNARNDGDPSVRRAALFAVLRIKGEPLPGDVPPEPEPIEVDGFHDSMLEAGDLKKAAKDIGAERLAIALRDGRAPARANAAAALGTLGSKAEDYGPALAVCLKDEAAEVRSAAATAIGEIGNDAGLAALVALLDKLGDPDEQVATAVKEAVTALGTAAIPAFVAALDSNPARAITLLLPAMVELGDDIIDPIEEVLSHVAVPVRANAIAALGLLGPDHAEKTRPLVEAALSDEADLVRARADEALERIDGIEPTPQFLEEKEMPVDGFDTVAIDDAGAKKAAKGVDGEQLRELLFDGRALVRENAAKTFASLGREANDYVPSLLVALKDSEVTVRTATARTLGELGHDEDEVVPGLAAALVKAPEELRDAVLEAVESFGKKAVEPLIGLLAYHPDWVLHTVGPISQQMHKTMVTPLAEAAAGADLLAARVNAINVLGFVGPDADSAEDTLLDLLEDKEITVRTRAAVALGKVGKPAAALADRLKDRLAVENNHTVKLAIAEALQYLRARS